MNPLITDITEASFNAEVEQAEAPVLLDFWAPWCGPCKMIQPILDELARMYQGCVKVAKVNADENPALAARFAVRGLPTLLLLKGGEVVERAVGLNPSQGKARFVELLDRHVTARRLQQQRSWQAFHGDAGLKRETIERVHAHIAAGQLLHVAAHSSPWPLCDQERGRYSLFGAALHGTAIEAYETSFGIPASAALLEDAVHNFLIRSSTDAQGKIRHFLDESARDYPLDWLEGIAPGADLKRAAPHFLQWLLLGLVDAPLPLGAVAAADAQAAVRAVALLHGRLAAGDEPSLEDWKAVREAALAACPSYADDPVSWGLAGCAAKFAWPVEDLGLSMRDGLDALASGLSRAALRSAYSPGDWARREAALAAVSAQDASRPPAGGDENSPAARAAQTLRQEFGPRDAAELEKLRLQLGVPWHQGLMRALAAAASGGAQ